jgi:hypothetical protein
MDFGLISWPSLFGEDTKRISVPRDIFANGNQEGWELVVRCNPKELQEEGKKLNHCVGGYSGKCINENSHIVSIVRKIDGQEIAISTIHLIAHYEDQYMQIKQNYGKSHNAPSQEAVAIARWLEQEIKAKRIKIDYVALKQAKQELRKNSVITRVGFDPLDDKKFLEVIKLYKKNVVPDFFKEKFQKLLELREIKVDQGFATNIVAFTDRKMTLALPPEKKKKEVTSSDIIDARRQKNEGLQKQLMHDFQANIDILFGERKVEAMPVESTTDDRKCVKLVSISPTITRDQILAVLREIRPLAKHIAESSEESITIDLQIKPLNNILGAVTKQKQFLSKTAEPAIDDDTPSTAPHCVDNANCERVIKLDLANEVA